jgi:uncharacterized protein YggE
MRIITLLGVASITVACAARDHVAANSSPAPATSANTTIVTATSATPTPVATGAVTSAGVSSSSETVNQTLVKRGYRVRRLSGQLKYCRTETLTGTHFSNTVCLTEAEILAQDQRTQGDLDTLNRAARAACPGGNSGCN